MKKIHISIVIPCYNCSATIMELYTRLVKIIKKISTSYEILFINDGSPQNDWEIIEKICRKDNKVVGINLSRNFGQHNAITAGLDYCSGEWIVVMDGDLQDQPEEIIKLYNKAREGFDLVIGRRTERKDTLLKKLNSKVFHAIFNYLSDVNFSGIIGNFGIYSSKVIFYIKQMKEQNRSFGLFAAWVGFHRAEIDIDHSSRMVGKSSYTFKKSLKLAFNSIVAYSNSLLKLNISIGFLLSFFSLAFSLWLFIRFFFWKIPVEGWTSLMVSIYFSTGLIMCSLGVVGLYIGKIFDETKNRPLYIVNHIINKKRES